MLRINFFAPIFFAILLSFIKRYEKMKVNPLIIGIFISAFIVFPLSCKKDAGQGGTSSIHGRVLTHHFMCDGGSECHIDTSYYNDNKDVFIIYGTDHTTYDDDYKTSYDGTYAFDYLQKGTYKLFCFTQDTLGYSQGYIYPNNPKIPVFITVQITSNHQTVQAPDIVIYKYN
jgi:hypothetical protein